MQLALDISSESPQSLRLTAKLLLDFAALLETAETTTIVPSSGFTAPPPPPPAPTATAPATSTANQTSAPAYVPPPPSNVVPIAPPPPPVTPAAPPAPASSQVPVPPPTTQGAASPATTAAATGTPDELDKSGMPWDARIHQKTKGTKKDGTWKIQKGIDSAIVSAVTQELHARMINSTAAGPPAAAAPPAPSAPIPIPPPGAVPPSANATVIPVVPPAPVHVPQATDVGMPDANGQGVVPAGVSFRDLVTKITLARNAPAPGVAPKLTGDQVNSIIQAAGAPSLQALGSMLHLIPAVDLAIDLAIASAP
jgi:hypothetical protein